MKVPPRISIILPTRGRARQLGACLARLALQTVRPGSFEVIVVHDGPDPEGIGAVRAGGSAFPLRAIEAERLGNAHTKNVALAAATAPIVLFINDDILPEPGFVEAHLAAHRDLGPDRPSLVVGHSPFAPSRDGPETIFDALLRETSIVFFYDRMIGADGIALRPADHDWGFRHAWSLNLSCPRAAALACGGFRPAIANCCYEDIEFAWRMHQACNAPVLFRPAARADHDHRMTPEDYLRREWRLGYSAFGFAHAAPDCARQTFGRDILDPGELTCAAECVERETGAEAAAREALDSLGRTAWADLPAAVRGDVLRLAAAAQIPVKRLTWRRGLLAAASGKIVPELFHPAHGLETAPGLRARGPGRSPATGQPSGSANG